MKIAYIYDVIYPYVKGGAEKRFWELAKRLSFKGHEVYLFGMKSWEGENSFIKEGVHIHGICKHHQLYLKTGLRSIAQVLYFTIHVLPVLWKKRFDIIDCNAFPYLPFFPARLFSLLRKVPLVLTCQEIWGSYWCSYMGVLKGSIARIIEKMVIRLSGNFVVYSNKIKKDIIRLGVNKKYKNIMVIANGIDLEMIKERPRDNQDSDLIFVGRLIKEKNVDVLIESVSLAKESLKNIKCIIIGGGPQKQSLIALTKKLNLEDNIVFKGFLENEEAISLMKSSKVFVFPSEREGFGIAVLEAMACGLVVITVGCPMNASTELITEGKNGFICKLAKEDISDNILNILKDEALRERHSRFAKTYVTEYDWNKIADLNERFYNNIINKEELNR